jgi:hypothetical protein
MVQFGFIKCIGWPDQIKQPIEGIDYR